MPLKVCPTHGYVFTDAGQCQWPGCSARLYPADPPEFPAHAHVPGEEPEVETPDERRARQAREQHDRMP